MTAEQQWYRRRSNGLATGITDGSQGAIRANHDPEEIWDPILDYMMSRTVVAEFMSPLTVTSRHLLVQNWIPNFFRIVMANCTLDPSVIPLWPKPLDRLR